MGSVILSGDWKLYLSHGVNENALFNLKDDSMEKNNVIAQNPELAARLTTQLKKWLKKVDAQMPPPVASPK